MRGDEVSHGGATTGEEAEMSGLAIVSYHNPVRLSEPAALTFNNVAPYAHVMNVRDAKAGEASRLPQFRVTLNSRCGRACFFCRPSGEAISTAATAELTVDDLIRVAKIVRRWGIESIKLTGGDPALYEPLEEAVYRLRSE